MCNVCQEIIRLSPTIYLLSGFIWRDYTWLDKNVQIILRNVYDYLAPILLVYVCCSYLKYLPRWKQSRGIRQNLLGHPHYIHYDFQFNRDRWQQLLTTIQHHSIISPFSWSNSSYFLICIYFVSFNSLFDISL